jgi:hydroxymethylpyrimidine/phosphomethylpyrimidine kinase
LPSVVYRPSSAVRRPSSEPAKVLTIAGSDSGGAAGLQADLKTFTALGAYGMSVATAATAQNSVQVTAVHFMPPDFVAAQLDAVLSDYGAAAVKTGFIGRGELIGLIAAKLSGYHLQNVVVDPVLVNHRGEAMFVTAVMETYRAYLLPLADLLTPNRREAELLLKRSILTPADGEEAARALVAQGAKAVLLKGVADGEMLVDLLFDGCDCRHFRAPRIQTNNTHGSGDALSAAIVVYLAQGLELVAAVAEARQFVRAGIAAAVDWRLGAGHGPIAIGWP